MQMKVVFNKKNSDYILDDELSIEKFDSDKSLSCAVLVLVCVR